jgi:hypothetical protein
VFNKRHPSEIFEEIDSVGLDSLEPAKRDLPCR